MTRPEDFVDLEPDLLHEQTLRGAETIASSWCTVNYEGSVFQLHNRVRRAYREWIVSGSERRAPGSLVPQQDDSGIRFPDRR